LNDEKKDTGRKKDKEDDKKDTGRKKINEE